jgi:DNA helicase-2/ATP-dependent DNA helicase PcrA
VVDAMRREAVWPPSPERDEGAAPWIEKVEAVLSGDLGVDDLLAEDGARAIYDENVRTIEALLAVDAVSEPEQRTRSLSATAAVRIALGKESAESVLYPIPQRPTEAQRLGTEVHAWIEERARGLIGLADEEALDEASLPPDRARVEQLKRTYVQMGFDDRRLAELDSGEPMAELPFTLKVSDELLVRGRIDAVYVTDGGGLEIVDFKTGAVPDEPDWGQLRLYAEALAELGLVRGPVVLTYAYLGAGTPIRETYTPQGLEWLQAGLRV